MIDSINAEEIKIYLLLCVAFHCTCEEAEKLERSEEILGSRRDVSLHRSSSLLCNHTLWTFASEMWVERGEKNLFIVDIVSLLTMLPFEWRAKECGSEYKVNTGGEFSVFANILSSSKGEGMAVFLVRGSVSTMLMMSSQSSLLVCVFSVLLRSRSS